MIPAHVPKILARDVRIERAFGSNEHQIASTLTDSLQRLIVPVSCLACISRARRGVEGPCRWCALHPAGFQWAPVTHFEPDRDDLAALTEAAAETRPQPGTGSRSDVPPPTSTTPVWSWAGGPVIVGG